MSVNETITSAAERPDEVAVPVQDVVTEKKREDMPVQEGKTVGLPYADNPKFKLRNVEVFYGDDRAIKDISLDIARNEVISFIGPSGCGKSTFLRCLNRMNDSIDICRVKGQLMLDDEDIYHSKRDVVELRARVGMVFQKPNPFPKSIYDNVAYGPRIHGLANRKSDLDDIVENSLRKALGRGEGSSGCYGNRYVRWPATTPVHRSCNCGESGSDPDGRAVFSPGSDCDRQGGRTDL